MFLGGYPIHPPISIYFLLIKYQFVKSNFRSINRNDRIQINEIINIQFEEDFIGKIEFKTSTAAILGCSDSRGMRQTFSCLSKVEGMTNLIRLLFGHVK